MAEPRILSVGTASPHLYLTQEEVYDFYERHSLMPAAQRDLYARILLDGPIRGRHFGLDCPAEILAEDPDAQIARFTEQGRRLAADAARTALAELDLAPADVGGIVVNTCTGYLCPGLTSYLAEDLGLSPHVKAFDIMGMGCGSAVPNLECGCGMLSRTNDKPVLCVAVEVCSATHLIDDDPGITVSNCIFGDGAAAVVLGNSTNGGPRLVDFETGLFPEHREARRYTTRQGRLYNTLTNRVPVIGAKCLQKVTMRLLARHELAVEDIRWWAVHAGGTAVLDRVGERFGLNNGELAISREVFENYGNMSSPTVLFALRDILKRNEAAGPGLLLAFGAGFTAFAALVQGPSE